MIARKPSMAGVGGECLIVQGYLDLFQSLAKAKRATAPRAAATAAMA
jgi:hypothetical protein